MSGGYGWKNAETFNVAVFVGEQANHRVVLSAKAWRDAEQTPVLSPARMDRLYRTQSREWRCRYLFADALKQWVTGTLPLFPRGNPSTIAEDLINAAVERVDWDEIAGFYLDQKKNGAA
jgi:hypothetical protein